VYLLFFDEVMFYLLFEVVDYVDFYVSEYYVINVGCIFCLDGNVLMFNWKYLLIGYYGCVGIVVVSGMDVVWFIG